MAGQTRDIRVAGLVLAAGEGRRYGMPKALVEHDGRLLVERAHATVRDGGCEPVVVVLGARAEEVRTRADLSGTRTIDNRAWPTGMGSSLRAGLSALDDVPVDAALVLLVDTPGVTAGAVRRVLEHAGPHALVMATYQGRPGHPVLLGREHWPEVYRMAVGDVGARRYLAAHPEMVTTVDCADIADGTDMDRP